ncbi:MAG TPA: DUF4430 domain-containing protein [Thermoplasmatales archaeon]|nr:DUF4430 domain-containing protein [Thermoplasmatales archaeon]
MRREILAAIAVLSTVFAAILAVYAYTLSQENDVSQSGDQPVQATLVITFANGSVWRYPSLTVHHHNATVLGLLTAAASQGNFTVETTYYGQYDSLLVGSIAGVENGYQDRYWLYWINGDYGMVGADRQPVQEGDTVEWKFTTYG